jgi:hypothetical protein
VITEFYRKRAFLAFNTSGGIRAKRHIQILAHFRQMIGRSRRMLIHISKTPAKQQYSTVFEGFAGIKSGKQNAPVSKTNQKP